MRLDVEGGAQLHVDLDGPDDGPVVLFLHGALASGRAFRGQLPALRDRYHVARVDQRGHGHSTHLDEAAWASLDIDVLARDALAVMDALSPRAPAHVVGVSMGGIVAARAASLRGERFASLSLWSAPPRPDALWMEFFARTPPEQLDPQTQRLAALWHGEPYWRSLARGLFACFASEESDPRAFESIARPGAAMVIQGTDDELLSAEDAELWPHRIAAPTRVLRAPGGHAFFADGRNGTRFASVHLREFLDQRSGAGGTTVGFPQTPS